MFRNTIMALEAVRGGSLFLLVQGGRLRRRLIPALGLMNTSRQIVHQADMKSTEVLRLYADGYRLVCRYCKIEFTTIPETLSPGETPTFVSCPKNRNHMHLVTDSAHAMRGVRASMNLRGGAASFRPHMKVVDHEPHFWFLLEEAGVLFLDVNCSHSFLGYSFLIQLNTDESAKYREHGHDFINKIAQAIQYTAPILQVSESPYKGRDLSQSRSGSVTAAVAAWRAGSGELP